MPLPEGSNHTVTGPEKSNLAEAQDKDFKVSIMNMFKDLKEDTNNALMKTIKTQTAEKHTENSSRREGRI